MEALQYVESKYSSAGAEKDSERFKAMFSDSEIAKNYKQGETKVRYNVQFGISKFISNLLVKDSSNFLFRFKFYETSTSKVQKEYDAYVKYLLKSIKIMIVTVL